MKKIFVIFLCTAFLISFVFKGSIFCQVTDEYREGKRAGKGAISEFSLDLPVLVGGFALGFGFGLIGTVVGIGYASIRSKTVEPEFFEGQLSRYQQGFRAGYKNQTRRRSMMNALCGGLLGTFIASSLK